MIHRIELFSPAKLNLFFRVLRKREDGFHEIASLYQAISLGDRLSIECKEGRDHLQCKDPTIPLNSSNLILRAAELFRMRTKIAQGFSFHLEKKIPIQAGLGGGSSNAATTLWGLNQLMGTNIDPMTLASWGATIGSDVPFFFTQGTAYCEGRGEKLTPVPLAKKAELWIAKPREGLSTPEVYRNTHPASLQQRDPKKSLQANLAGDFAFYNDLEVAAFSLLPSLQDLRASLLRLGFTHVHMTGSGTAFFCLGNVKEPKLEHVQFFPVQFTRRDALSWYKFP